MSSYHPDSELPVYSDADNEPLDGWQAKLYEEGYRAGRSDALRSESSRYAALWELYRNLQIEEQARNYHLMAVPNE